MFQLCWPSESGLGQGSINPINRAGVGRGIPPPTAEERHHACGMTAGVTGKSKNRLNRLCQGPRPCRYTCDGVVMVWRALM